MMATQEEIHHLLLVIQSQIHTLDGKVNLVARSNRGPLLATLEEVIRAKPIVGRIYNLLDGTRTQDDIVAALAAGGTPSSKQAVSRWLNEMSGEHGLAELIPGAGRGKRYRKNREMDKALNLTPKVERWLTEIDKEAGRKPASKQAKGSRG